MTSSIWPSTDSVLGFRAELTDGGCVWLLSLPGAPQPRRCHHTGIGTVFILLNTEPDTTMSEGDRKRMKEARRISASQVVQEDRFLTFRKMFGVTNGCRRNSNLFLIFGAGQSTRRIKEKPTRTSAKSAPIRHNK